MHTSMQKFEIFFDLGDKRASKKKKDITDIWKTQREREREKKK